jgi:hypothetical protein
MPWLAAIASSFGVLEHSLLGFAKLTRGAFPDLGGCGWRLTDLLGDAQYDRSGADLVARGLYLDVPPWSHHVFEMTML